MTSRSQIWDGLQWIDLTGGVDTDFLDTLYLRLDFANNDGPWLPLSGGTMTGQIGFNEGINNLVFTNSGGATLVGDIRDVAGFGDHVYFRAGGSGDMRGITIGSFDNPSIILDRNSFQANVPIRAQSGDAANPGYRFADGADMGMYRVAANELGLSVAGEVKLTISSTLNLFEHPIHVKEQTFGVAHYRLDDDAFRASPVFENTVTSASTVFVTTGGVLMRSTAINVAVDAAQQTTMDARVGQSFFDNTLEAVDLAAVVNHLLDRIESLEAFHP